MPLSIRCKKPFLIGEQLLVEFFWFFIRLGKEKGHRQVSFSLMFTYSAGLYDEPVC